MSLTLPRYITGVRSEKTGEKHEDILAWHRVRLGRECYMTDVDGLEYRFRDDSLLPVAIIEWKRWHVVQGEYVASTNTRAIFELARRASVPMYVCWYDLDDLQFRVWHVSRYPFWDGEAYKRIWKVLTEKQMIQLLEGF